MTCQATINQAVAEATKLDNRVMVELDQYPLGHRRRFSHYRVYHDDHGYYVRPGKGGGWKGYLTDVKTTDHGEFQTHVFTLTPARSNPDDPKRT